MTYRMTLVEVALPLNDVYREATREKSIRHGHPSTLHLRWARRPLAAGLAALFASLVDDPPGHGSDAKPTAARQRLRFTARGALPRERLVAFTAERVTWEIGGSEGTIETAREFVGPCTNRHRQPVPDPGCRGSSSPLTVHWFGLWAAVVTFPWASEHS